MSERRLWFQRSPPVKWAHPAGGAKVITKCLNKWTIQLSISSTKITELQRIAYEYRYLTQPFLSVNCTTLSIIDFWRSKSVNLPPPGYSHVSIVVVVFSAVDYGSWQSVEPSIAWLRDRICTEGEIIAVVCNKIDQRPDFDDPWPTERYAVVTLLYLIMRSPVVCSRKFQRDTTVWDLLPREIFYYILSLNPQRQAFIRANKEMDSKIDKRVKKWDIIRWAGLNHVPLFFTSATQDVGYENIVSTLLQSHCNQDVKVFKEDN